MANARYAAALKSRAVGADTVVESIRIGEALVQVAAASKHTDEKGILIDFQGGAFVFGGGEACIAGTRIQAEQHGVRCYGVDYRMPPAHPFPAAVEDGLATYRHLLGTHSPSRIVMSGRSAGGNVALSTLLRAKEEQLPMPAGLILLSPEADLTEAGDSFEVNRMVDVVLPGSLMRNNLLYANGADLMNPLVSPLFGDLRNLPSTFVQSGTRDLFLSNAVRLHRRLCQSGVRAELHVFEAMPHGGFSGESPEDRELQEETARFARSCWTS